MENPEADQNKYAWFKMMTWKNIINSTDPEHQAPRSVEAYPFRRTHDDDDAHDCLLSFFFNDLSQYEL